MNRRQFTKREQWPLHFLLQYLFADFRLPDHALQRNLKKGIMWGSIGTGKTVMERFLAAKLAGFDGVEVDSHLDRNEVLRPANQPV